MPLYRRSLEYIRALDSDRLRPSANKKKKEIGLVQENLKVQEDNTVKRNKEELSELKAEGLKVRQLRHDMNEELY